MAQAQKQLFGRAYMNALPVSISTIIIDATEALGDININEPAWRLDGLCVRRGEKQEIEMLTHEARACIMSLRIFRAVSEIGGRMYMIGPDPASEPRPFAERLAEHVTAMFDASTDDPHTAIGQAIAEALERFREEYE